LVGLVDGQAGGGVGIRVIVTGGAAFIGTLLVRRLLAGPVAAGGAEAAPVDEVVVADLAGVAGRLGTADVISHLAG
jgi:D-erythronate 2-dehydrogenase